MYGRVQRDARPAETITLDDLCVHSSGPRSSLSGVDLAATTQRLLAYLPTVAVLLAVAFDSWLWKLPGMNKLTGRPRLDGTWRTTLTPHADSHIPDGGNRGPIRALICIEQTFWTLSVSLITDQSRSQSSTASLAANTDTAAYATAPSMTRTPPGTTTSTPPLDTARTWDVCREPGESPMSWIRRP